MVPLPKVLLNGNLVIASGSILIPKGGTVEIVPIPVGNNPVRYRFTFETKPGEPTVAYPDEVVGNARPWRLVNFDDPLGAALLQPTNAGVIGGRTLALNMAVHSIGPPDTAMRMFSYTFTLAGDADV